MWMWASAKRFMLRQYTSNFAYALMESKLAVIRQDRDLGVKVKIPRKLSSQHVAASNGKRECQSQELLRMALNRSTLFSLGRRNYKVIQLNWLSVIPRQTEHFHTMTKNYLWTPLSEDVVMATKRDSLTTDLTNSLDYQWVLRWYKTTVPPRSLTICLWIHGAISLILA